MSAWQNKDEWKTYRIIEGIYYFFMEYDVYFHFKETVLLLLVCTSNGGGQGIRAFYNIAVHICKRS